MVLELGGIVIDICSDRELPVSSIMAPFYKKNNDRDLELSVHITWDWKNARHPVSQPVGEDLLQNYYKEDNYYYCEAKGGKAPVTCTCYMSNFSWMECAINEKPFIEPPDTLEKILRLLPMRAIFTHFQTLFLHASQVAVQGTGIVFSAASGTGKTTQAKLWQQYAKATIVCNDRTLIRQKNGIWQTYGYPIDGSEPVRSNEVNKLGCIVLLKQGSENVLSRLRTGKAVSLLMEQSVIDCWDVQARASTLTLLIEIAQKIPVYQLICTPDKGAVDLLKRCLVQEGVINGGADSEASLG